MVNLFRGAETPPVQPGDFFTTAAVDEPPTDPEAHWRRQKLLVEMLNAAFGGTDLRKGGAPA